MDDMTTLSSKQLLSAYIKATTEGEESLAETEKDYY
jgi:hypothetical protein